MESTKRCLNCGTEAPVFARFCPNCAYRFPVEAGQQASESRQAIVPLAGVGEGTASAPILPAGPQVSAPGIPSMPAGPQTGSPTLQPAIGAHPSVPTLPGGPETGMPGVPGTPAGPQMGAPSIPGIPVGPQAGAPGVPGIPAGPQSGTLASQGASSIGRAATKAATSGLRYKLLGTVTGKIITAALVTAVVATTTVTGVTLATGHNPLTLLASQGKGSGQSATARSPTAMPTPPLEVTYIGSDGNVWDMTLANGTPKKLTTDAQPPGPNPQGGIIYSGLKWSSDGSELAVLRTSGDFSNATYQLLLFSPKGSVLSRVPLSNPPFIGDPFAWSPDGRLIAFRHDTGKLFNPSDPNDDRELGNLVIIDAQTGSIQKTIPYDAGHTGCGGVIPPLTDTIFGAHHAYLGLDAFEWSASQQSVLVSYGCGSTQAALVDLNTGATASNYPQGARYQPGGNLMVGLWDFDGPLGLSDSSGNHVRSLVNPLPANQGNAPLYAIGLGQATWSSDGQSVYYEYEDGIWQIGMDGSNNHEVVAGTPYDGQQVATVAMAPSVSPDGHKLLYLQLHGSDFFDPSSSNPAPDAVTGQWYVTQPDGTSPMPLLQTPLALAYTFTPADAVWRPTK